MLYSSQLVQCFRNLSDIFCKLYRGFFSKILFDTITSQFIADMYRSVQIGKIIVGIVKLFDNLHHRAARVLRFCISIVQIQCDLFDSEAVILWIVKSKAA